MRKRKDNLYQRIGIYAIHCLINDKMYIGQTEMNFGDRRDNHYALLNNNKHHINDLDLQNDWNKYGKENFEFIILHDLQEGENITEIEEKYIKQYKDNNKAYNRAYGGIKCGGVGFHLSEDAKRKIGEKNSINLTGKKQSEETIKKRTKSISQAYQNLPQEEKDIRAKQCSKINKGRKHNEDFKNHMREIQKIKPNGAKYDIDTIRYIRYLYEKENMSNKEIAEKLSISRSTIYLITSYRRWKYA